jgi:hypothetical protein
MNEFYEIKEIFKNKNRFEEITRCLMTKDIVVKGKNIIEELDCNNYLNSRDLLSLFLINRFPKDTIGEISIENNKNLVEFVKNLLEKKYSENEELKIDIIKYSYYFKTWKNEDIEILKNQLFNEYHQLTVDIINTSEEESDKKTIYEETQKKILECAQQIGGDEFINKIQDYSPVLIDIEELQKEYDNAYNDIFIKEFNEKNYEKLSGLLEFMKNVFKTLKPKEGYDIEKIIDTPYIVHKLTFNKFTYKMQVELFNYMLDFLEKNQSQANDEELNSVRAELKLKEIQFPVIFIRIMNLLRNLIHDFEMMQNALNKKK